MKVTIRISGRHRTEFLNEDLEGIVTDSLQKFAHQLKQVHLYFEDINKPRGGADKQCRCVLHLRRLPPVVIQDQDENVHVLTHRVANRATYALSQANDRQTPHLHRTNRHNESGHNHPDARRFDTARIKSEQESDRP